MVGCGGIKQAVMWSWVWLLYTHKICFQTHSKTRREEGEQGGLAYIPKTEATSLATLGTCVTQMCINQDWVNSNKAVIISEIH